MVSFITENTDTYTSTNPHDSYNNMNPGWVIWPEALVLSIKTGFDLDLIKNFGIGFSAESPKIWVSNLASWPVLGNQQSYGLYKLYSIIRF